MRDGSRKLSGAAQGRGCNGDKQRALVLHEDDQGRLLSLHLEMGELLAGPMLGTGCWGYKNELDMVPLQEYAWSGGGL